MAERRCPGISTCRYTTCMLINCGALAPDWDGWPWCDLSTEARVILFILVRTEPLRWVGPKAKVAGCFPWFERLGLALTFTEGNADGW
jgi:hypothetical protein